MIGEFSLPVPTLRAVPRGAQTQLAALTKGVADALLEAGRASAEEERRWKLLMLLHRLTLWSPKGVQARGRRGATGRTQQQARLIRDRIAAAWRGERGRPRGWGPVRMDSVRVVGLMNGREGGTPRSLMLSIELSKSVFCVFGLGLKTQCILCICSHKARIHTRWGPLDPTSAPQAKEILAFSGFQRFVLIIYQRFFR